MEILLGLIALAAIFVYFGLTTDDQRKMVLLAMWIAMIAMAIVVPITEYVARL